MRAFGGDPIDRTCGQSLGAKIGPQPTAHEKMGASVL